MRLRSNVNSAARKRRPPISGAAVLAVCCRVPCRSRLVARAPAAVAALSRSFGSVRAEVQHEERVAERVCDEQERPVRHERHDVLHTRLALQPPLTVSPRLIGELRRACIASHVVSALAA